jgi:hypothetical protein
MGLLLIILGLILWLAVGWSVIGVVCIIVGVFLLFAPWPGVYGYSYYRGRSAAPPP